MKKFPYYPVFVDLEGKKALVVGGGDVAERKIETLLDYGAEVHLVAHDITPLLKRYVEEGRVRFRGREFVDGAMEGAFLVTAATDDRDLNRRVSLKAKERGILVNAVDQPGDCNFIVPSMLRRGDLIIAVSTSGKSPALAKKIRKELEDHFGSEYGTFLALMGKLRAEVISRGGSSSQNKILFQRLIDSDLLNAIGRRDWPGAASAINRVLGTEFSGEYIRTLARGAARPATGEKTRGEADL